MYLINNIASVIHAKATINLPGAPIEYLLTDSRRIAFPDVSLFFALHSERRNGHDFIGDVYKQGVRNFVTEKYFDASEYADANFLIVENSLHALQQLAAYHRSQFSYPVIGITGSNGKTIVKEWLYQLLSPDYKIIRSPRSYNSQIGVPLSVWQMSNEYELGIFEAGISKPGEMEALQKIIQPTIGVFTNIGNAHAENFKDINEKAEEKIQLFKATKDIIFCADKEPVDKALKHLSKQVGYFSWGSEQNNKLQIAAIAKHTTSTEINAIFETKEVFITIPFTDDASIENAITCWCVCLYFNLSQETIQKRMSQLQPVDMRLQLMEAENNCSLINDSYSFDINSFNIALDFLLQQQQHPRKTVIVSDLPSATTFESYREVAGILHAKKIDRVIAIGEQWFNHQHLLRNSFITEFYKTTEAFIHQLTTHHFNNETLLLKGARTFGFERIVSLLEKKVHQTVMEINLTALAHNLKQYQLLLKPGTKLMAMVKAFGYGSGSAEVANVLQFHKVDYLAVAYADEGTELRNAGIHLPIMVLNADEAAFESLIENNLEPELFSFQIFNAFDKFLQKQGLQQYPVHIKLDTGMHRLGFEEKDIAELSNLLHNNHRLAVKSVFSHLAASEDASEDAFTLQQVKIFESCCTQLQTVIGYPFIRHIANSAAIFRHPQMQFDMVRLGIGLYGVDSTNELQLSLQTVGTLKTTIAQLRQVKAGDTIGYNRKGKLQRDSLIATIRIGYADGFSRRLGNGAGKVFINGKLADVIGTVCMDMAMVDVTDIPAVKAGGEVEIFGKNISVNVFAKWCGTIPYEILTGISQRVKRVYIEE